MPETPDLTEFARYAQPRKRPCLISLGEFSEEDRAALDAAVALDNKVIPAGAIVGWLAKRGIEISAQQVYAHRMGRCSCYDER